MRRSFARSGFAVVGFVVVLSVAAAVRPQLGSAANTASYTLTHTFTVGGDGGWDYLTYDPTGRRLFVSRASRVMVIDPATGISSGEIADTPGVHGIALAQDLGKGFTSNGRGNSVTVFDLATLKTTATIPIAGQNPDAILYDAATKRIFTFNGRSNDATAIDAQTNAVIGTIPLPGTPEFAASGGDGTIYVNIEDKSEIVAIDAKQNAVLHTWPLAPCDGPSGLAIDVAHQRLFAGCSNKLMAIVNAQTGALVTTVPIGEGVDATAFDPGSGFAFSSNGDGTLTVVHEDSPDKYTVVQNVPTQKYARTMAVDPATHNAYLVTAKITLGPPAAGETRPKRTIVSGSFALLVVSPA